MKQSSSIWLGLFALSSLAFATNKPKEVPMPVVKVTAGVCNSSGNISKGTGLFLTSRLAAGKARWGEENPVFVLTSEHVILPFTNDGEKACHHATYPATGVVYELKVVNPNWGKGLALLQVVKRPVGIEIPEARDLFEGRDPLKNEKGTAVGYPSEVGDKTTLLEEELIEDPRGFVSLAKSMSRNPLAALPSVVEMTGAWVERGMSGGPLLSDVGKVLGILSHLQLAFHRGSRKRLSVIGEDGADHIFVIPASEALEFVENTVKQEKPEPDALIRGRSLSGNNIEAVNNSNVQVEAQLPENRDTAGGDMEPVGGADGIGGPDRNAAEGPKRALVRFLGPVVQATYWVERLFGKRLESIGGSSEQVRYFINRAAGRSAWTRVHFETLNEFFLYLKSDSLLPVRRDLRGEPVLSAAPVRPALQKAADVLRREFFVESQCGLGTPLWEQMEDRVALLYQRPELLLAGDFPALTSFDHAEFQYRCEANWKDFEGAYNAVAAALRAN